MKTGTTTLNHVLTKLGYKVGYDTWTLLKPIVRNQWDVVKEHLEKWDAVEDNPIPMIYKEIDRMIPGCKFILTVRDQEEWYRSVTHHIGDFRNVMHEWLFGPGKGLPRDDKDHTIRVYDKHIEEVRAYFRDRPDDLLVIDITKTKSWEPICAFLGKPVPNVPFPHANATNYEAPKYPGIYNQVKLLIKRIKYAFVVQWYHLNGYIPQR